MTVMLLFTKADKHRYKS